MQKETKPLFNTDLTNFDWAWSDSNSKESELIKSYSESHNQGLASGIVSLTTVAGAATITVKCKLAFRQGTVFAYSKEYTVEDENGVDLTFNSGVAGAVDFNLYDQAWWKPNNGFKILLSGNTGLSLAGTASIILL